jgi:urea transport system permease protein
MAMALWRAILVMTMLCLLGEPAAAADLTPLVNALGQGDFKAREAAIQALAETGDPLVVAPLEALGQGDLYVRRADRSVVIAKSSGDVYLLRNPLSGADEGQAQKAEIEKIKINNALRRTLASVMGGLTLFSSDAATRLQAAQAIFKSGDASLIAALGKAIAQEADTGVKDAMEAARAAATLSSNFPEAEKLAAIAMLAKRGDRDTAALLSNFAARSEGPVSQAAAAAAKHIETGLALWDMVQNLWYGLSLGSVLLLAAIGLAITFGVMGVINMAHGEMVMIGAYTAVVVQALTERLLPQASIFALPMAIPAAFLVAGLVGVVIERGVIRHLYGRPLETLLATWGISLVLQQTVRTIFGPTNQEVAVPPWLAGSFTVTDGLSLTMNRVAIVIFAAAVFTGLTLLIRRTAFGLQMRAVTQNRTMANSVGIRSGHVDALTFGLGSGIAGIAGVALSQIDNVSPNLGQSYIIDSFLVVVFGGVGNLWGTLLGAMSLGIANKFLEPYAGAVLGKIVILVAVILFIQKRPRGLFALKGRAVEA